MKEIKKILVITPWYPSPKSPLSATFVRDQVEILNNHFNDFDKNISYEFAVLHIKQPVDWVNLFVRKKYPERLQINNDGSGISVIHQQAVIPSHRFKFLKQSRIRKNEMQGWDKAINVLGGVPELIIAVTLSGLIITDDLVKELGLNIPVILHEHSNPVSMHMRTAERRQQAIRALNNTTYIVAAGNKSYDQLQEITAGKKIYLIYNAVHQDFCAASIKTIPPTTPLNLISVGHLVPDKAQSIQLKALSKISTSTVAKLEIIGEGNLKESLLSLSKELGLNNRLILRGGLKREEIIHALQAADVFIFSSRTENCPVALLEAQTIGLPCVCIENGGSENVLLPGNGIVVKKDDSGGTLQVGIEKIIADIDTYDRTNIKDNAMRHYSPEIFARKFYDVVQKALTSAIK